jgi:hypothetical protein
MSSDCRDILSYFLDMHYKRTKTVIQSGTFFTPIAAITTSSGAVEINWRTVSF